MTDDVIIKSASRTDKGNVRDRNEDACLERPESGLWLVADGMGGHDDGDVASTCIVNALRDAVFTGSPGEYLDKFDDLIEAVNSDLYEMWIDRDKPSVVGSTLAGLIAFPGYCIVAWVGDSRVYRLRSGRLEQISRDHSQIEELIEHGRLSRDKAEEHPEANIITRAVGGQAEIVVDMAVEAIEADDRYLLCSDGLYKDVSEQEISALLTQGDCRVACDALLDEALQRECSDNVTAIVVDFSAARSDTVAADVTES